MKTFAQLLAGEAIIAASWAVTDDDHNLGFLIGLLVAGALVVWSARRERGDCQGVPRRRRDRRSPGTMPGRWQDESESG